MTKVTIKFDGEVVSPKITTLNVGDEIEFVNDNDEIEDVIFLDNKDPTSSSANVGFFQPIPKLFRISAKGKINVKMRSEGTYKFSYKEEGGEDPSGEIIVKA